MEGTHTVLVNGRTAVAHVQPEDPDLYIGRPIVILVEITPPPPPDRLYPGYPDSARPGVGGPLAFQSPPVHGKDKSKPLDIQMG